MRAEFINPFVKAAYEVLKAELKTPVERGQLSLQESDYTSQDVTIMVAVTGRVEGITMYGLSEVTAKKIASAMMGQPVPVFDKLAESAIAELGNIITGHASGELEKAGYPCTISPPTVIIGRGVIISTVHIKRLIIPLKTQLGELEVSVALQASPR